MTTETDFAKILERLETKIDSLDEKIDTKTDSLSNEIDTKIGNLSEKIDTKTDSLGEKIQSLDSRLARVEENTSNLSQQFNKQHNRGISNRSFYNDFRASGKSYLISLSMS